MEFESITDTIKYFYNIKNIKLDRKYLYFRLKDLAPHKIYKDYHFAYK